MEISPEQYEKIRGSLPLQPGDVRLTNLQVLNAVPFVAEERCKWRGLPERFGNWHTIYLRMKRWAQNGVLDRVFEKLQLKQIVSIRIEAFALNSTSAKVHPDGTGALKDGQQPIGESRGGWKTKIHLISADARTALTFAMSPGNHHDAPHRLALLEQLGSMPKGIPLSMDKAYADNEARQLVLDLGMTPVVPPKSNRIGPWEYNRAL